MKPEDRKRLKQHIEMIVEHKIPSNVVFCPNCEKDTECIHTAELYECKECGEDFAKYIVSRKPANSDVSVTQDVSTDIKTGQSIENANPDYYKQENARLTAELEQEKDNCGKFFLALEEIYDTLGMDDHTGSCIPEIEKLKTKNDDLTVELAELRERTRWIPVSERLPKRDGFYLVLENVNQVAGYYHWCKQFGWNTDGGRINIQSVTHWMPLPEPPEEIK